MQEPSLLAFKGEQVSFSTAVVLTKREAFEACEVCAEAERALFARAELLKPDDWRSVRAHRGSARLRLSPGRYSANWRMPSPVPILSWTILLESNQARTPGTAS